MRKLNKKEVGRREHVNRFNKGYANQTEAIMDYNKIIINESFRMMAQL